MQILVLGAVFLGVVALLVGAYVFVNRRQLAASERARARLLDYSSSPVETAALLKEHRASDVPLLNKLLSGREWTQVLQEELDRAGAKINVGTFLLAAIATPLALGFLGSLFAQMVGALAGMAIGILLPTAWLKRGQKKMRKAFEAQLPDALDMMVSAMRAGYSLQAAAKFIGEEVPAPLGPVFTRFYDEQRLGIDVRTALLHMQEGVDSIDLKMFVTAVLIQRDTGGNLSEVLANITDLMRQRAALRGHVETLTAEPKWSARLLAVLPVIMFFLLSLMNPQLMRPLTTTTIGKLMLIGAAVSVVLGYAVMMKIADIEV